MKRILMSASLVLAMFCMNSCKNGPQEMADKFCDARALAIEGQIDKAEKLFDEITAWGAQATEVEKSEYRRLLLNK